MLVMHQEQLAQQYGVVLQDAQHAQFLKPLHHQEHIHLLHAQLVFQDITLLELVQQQHSQAI